MKAEDIRRPVIDEQTFPFSVDLRIKAPKYLVELVKIGVLDSSLNPYQFVPLTGGRASACYLVNSREQPKIVKLRPYGAVAEAEALRTWRNKGLSVPEVYDNGEVPSTSQADSPVKYLIMEAILDSDGNLAKSGEDHAITHSESLPELGRLMGLDLAKIHQIPTDLPYGAYHDMPSPKPAATLGELLANRFSTERDYLQSIVTVEQLSAIEGAARGVESPEQRTVIHGDTLPNNVLVPATAPLAILYFDPLPDVRDPYWDLVHITNRQELLTAYAQNHPEDTGDVQMVRLEQAFVDRFLDSYWKTVNYKPDQKRFLLNGIFRGLSVLKRKEKDINGNQKLGLIKRNVSMVEGNELRRNIIRKQAEQLVRL